MGDQAAQPTTEFAFEYEQCQRLGLSESGAEQFALTESLGGEFCELHRVLLSK
jgi:hypothetical protein